LSKNPGHLSDGRFELDLSVFFGYFLCAKESDPRASAEKIPGWRESACVPTMATTHVIRAIERRS
jgi:hypothetical protein